MPIVTFAPAARTDLTSGKKVYVVATTASQGAFVAQRVVVVLAPSRHALHEA
ncbi:hypothetical protein [Caballeronia mineralivorans]|uniref:hypothetical protein n=1 Tax=Caballeronia mineralivorans TaxID=2010198 RepID=UPI0023F02CF7|nr:hypothetical protein [Caballeronia mineralivorans]